MNCQELALAIRGHYRAIILITDENLYPLYGKFCCDLFGPVGKEFYTIIIPPGESSKSREMKSFIEDQLISYGVVSGDLLLAFGGGVITDLVGFVAATYMRGIAYISIPTSLMGMVDAAIGGKTAINLPQGKNLIGAFYPPTQVIFEKKFLETLSEMEMRYGLQEVLKYGLIWDRGLWDLIKEGGYDLGEVIHRSVAIKNAVVFQDQRDKGIRRILNFGHTVGHAIELLSGYEIPHGEAVWMGLLVESAISHRLGLLSKDHLEEIKSVLFLREIQCKSGIKISKNLLYEAMRHDKKTTDNKPRMVVLQAIGSVVSYGGEYCTPIEREDIDEICHSTELDIW